VSEATIPDSHFQRRSDIAVWPPGGETVRRQWEKRGASNSMRRRVWTLVRRLVLERHTYLKYPRENDVRGDQIAWALPQIPAGDEIGVHHVEEIESRLERAPSAEGEQPAQTNVGEVRVGERDAADRQRIDDEVPDRRPARELKLRRLRSAAAMLVIDRHTEPGKHVATCHFACDLPVVQRGVLISEFGSSACPSVNGWLIFVATHDVLNCQPSESL
jgi:hypothetical protein